MSKPKSNYDTEARIIEAQASLTTDRRSFLALAGASAAMGLVSTEQPAKAVQQNATDTGSDSRGLTLSDIRGVERVQGVTYTDEQRKEVLGNLPRLQDAVRDIRTYSFENGDAPAPSFDPRLPGATYPEQSNTIQLSVSDRTLPRNEDDIAFARLSDLSHWIESRQITAADLTEIYLRRIDRYASTLECFVTVTADLAREQAAAADALLATGTYLGPLHGIPYSLKDLADTAGIKTTWGAEPFKNRIPDQDATLVRLLRDAGAILLGKATSGALAYGDVWYGGVTRNPWNMNEGSSGSSAGPASSVAAGLAAFGIGTETLGSIISPSNRCGTAGLRPTFGRVSRKGLMALAWSLDKAGPITRYAEDTAAILSVINGYDPSDAGSLSHGFDYTPDAYSDLKVGYMPAAFDSENTSDIDRAALEAAKGLGYQMQEIALPDMPYGALFPIIRAEAAAVFDELVLSGEINILRFEGANSRGATSRLMRMLSATDYVNMERLRRHVMRMAHDVFSDVDVIIGPNYAENMLLITNYTGHPQIAFRAGFTEQPTRTRYGEADDESGTTFSVPQAFSVFGKLFGEGPMIHVANQLEQALGAVSARPSL